MQDDDGDTGVLPCAVQRAGEGVPLLFVERVLPLGSVEGPA
ncbi:MAG: hypothetical protein AAF354_08500 [Pseudomonadota bacterium]